MAKLARRAKILIGVALGCAGYVVMMPDSGQTIEPARATGVPSHRSNVPADPHPVLAAAFLPAGARVVPTAAAAALFASQSWYVAPPPPPPVHVVPQAPPAPTAPALPYAFLGSYQLDGAGQTYFLSAGDRVYDVKIGDTLDNTYSVDGVRGGQLLLTYLPLKIQQSLPVGELP